MTGTTVHECKPIWVPIRGPIATCPEHLRQPVGITARAEANAGTR
jgi:hypothetical protein